MVAGCAYYTHGLLLLVHRKLENSLKELSYFLKHNLDHPNINNIVHPIATI